MPKSYSAEILDTVEAFLDTNPDLAGVTIAFERRSQDGPPGQLAEKVTVNGVEHLVVVKVAQDA